VIKEWETVGGLRFYRRWAVLRSGVRVAEAAVDRTVINAGLRVADLAAQPADGKPIVTPSNR
jgi:hypothetical protein